MLSRIDYCNVALAGLPAISLAPLQRVINAAARFVANLRPRDNVSHVLRDLHWLPIRERISYKVCLVIFNIVNGTAPTYMTGMVTRISDRTNKRKNERTNERTSEQTNERTNEQTNERTDGRTDGRTDVRTDGRTDGRTYGRMDGQTDKQTDRQTNKQPNERTNKRMIERTNERINEQTNERTNVRTGFNYFETKLLSKTNSVARLYVSDSRLWCMDSGDGGVDGMGRGGVVEGLLAVAYVTFFFSLCAVIKLRLESDSNH